MRHIFSVFISKNCLQCFYVLLTKMTLLWCHSTKNMISGTRRIFYVFISKSGSPPEGIRVVESESGSPNLGIWIWELNLIHTGNRYMWHMHVIYIHIHMKHTWCIHMIYIWYTHDTHMIHMIHIWYTYDTHDTHMIHTWCIHTYDTQDDLGML